MLEGKNAQIEGLKTELKDLRNGFNGQAETIRNLKSENKELIIEKTKLIMKINKNHNYNEAELYFAQAIIDCSYCDHRGGSIVCDCCKDFDKFKETK